MGYSSDSEWLKELAKKISEDESNEFIVDIERMDEFELSYNILLAISKGAKVTYEVEDSFKGVGSVSLIGKEITFEDTDALVCVSKIASNVNVYAKLDGSVVMDFSFYGISKPGIQRKD